MFRKQTSNFISLLLDKPVFIFAFCSQYGFLSFRSEVEKSQVITLADLSDCSKKLGKSGVETTVYLRALEESKGLDMQKHRDQVENELDKASKEKQGITIECLLLGIFATCAIDTFNNCQILD